MPLNRCKLKSGKLGWRWGNQKCYASRADAIKQMKAILASGYQENVHKEECLTCNAKKKIRNPLRADPSRTATLRRVFETELKRRLRKIAEKVAKVVGDEDAFGLQDREMTTNEIVGGRWRFLTRAEQVKKFEEWLRKEMGEDLLDEGKQEAYWQKFIEEAYKKGQGRAFDDVRKPAVAEDWSWYNGTKDEFLRSAFGRPMQIEKVQLMAGRVFTDLKGFSEVVATSLSRTLTEAFAQGQNPHTVARKMRDDIGLSSTRAATIARTEVIRAHAEGQLDAMERLGVDEVGVMVEWDTAGDGRVCKLCSAMDGVVLTVKEARGMIPRHPNCRCAHIPANVGEDMGKQKRGQAKIKEAIEESISLEAGRNETQKEARAKTRWVGADRKVSKKRPRSILNGQ